MGKAASILPRVKAAVAVLVMSVVTGAGCTAGRPPAVAESTGSTADGPGAASGARPGLGLDLLDVVTRPSEPDGHGRASAIGSLSGLARDARSGRYLAVIDDRQPSRAVWLDIQYTDRLTVAPLALQALEPGPGVDERLVRGADLEGLVALPDGSFVAVEEGHDSTGLPGQPPAGIWPAALLSLSPDLVVTRLTPWPAMFGLGAAVNGTRDNQGAEALARTPDGRLVAGLEQPRYGDKPASTLRDGRPFGGGTGGPGRLLEFVPDGPGWRAARQWLYPLPPTPEREGFPDICNDGEMGLTDLLALDQTRFLALERACLINPDSRLVRNVIRIQLVDTADADDIASVATVVPSAVRAVRKSLVLDFDTLLPRLPESLQRLENFEAMAFGPPLPDGGRSLLVMADDNFRASQQTAFVLFRITGGDERLADLTAAPTP